MFTQLFWPDFLRSKVDCKLFAEFLTNSAWSSTHFGPLPRPINQKPIESRSGECGAGRDSGSVSGPRPNSKTRQGQMAVLRSWWETGGHAPHEAAAMHFSQAPRFSHWSGCRRPQLWRAQEGTALTPGLPTYVSLSILSNLQKSL